MNVLQQGENKTKKLLNILPSLLVNNHFIMNNSGQVLLYYP